MKTDDRKESGLTVTQLVLLGLQLDDSSSQPSHILFASVDSCRLLYRPTKAVRTSAIQLQYNCNTRFFSCITVVLHLCGPLQYNAAIQVFYNLQKTCRLFAAVVKKTCIAVVLRLCGLLQCNKIFVLFYCILLFSTTCRKLAGYLQQL